MQTSPQRDIVHPDEMQDRMVQQPQPGTSRDRDVMVPGEEIDNQDLRSAREHTDKVILDAEQFNATINAPQGKLADMRNFVEVDERVQRLRDLDNDDDFFHVTCHLDSHLTGKIQRGDFVDLECLLPKEKGGMLDMRDENVMELISKGGATYFAPKTHDSDE